MIGIVNKNKFAFERQPTNPHKWYIFLNTTVVGTATLAPQGGYIVDIYKKMYALCEADLSDLLSGIHELHQF